MSEWNLPQWSLDMSASCSRFQTLPKCCIPSCHYRLINNVCSNMRTPRELCVSQLCPWQSLQGLLALTVPVFMHETSRQIVGRAGQSLSDGCQLAASLTAFSTSSSSSMSSHHGRPRKRALWSPIMIRGECAALGWLLTVAAAQIAWMMENQWDLILVCQYEY